MNELKIIDFNEIEGPVYSGRPRGEKLRVLYNLDQLDKEICNILIKVPENTYSITSGFFLGFFGPSIMNLGKDEFNKKYNFEASKTLTKAFDDYISLVEQKRQFNLKV